MTSCLKRSDTKHGVAKHIGQLLLTIVRWYGDEDSCSNFAPVAVVKISMVVPQRPS